jgi:general secretion pathway protein A
MMSRNKLQARYGLKYNPFLPGIPDDDLWRPEGFDMFFYRVENIIFDGGFAMISGESGMGKSKALHLLASSLRQTGDIVVGVMERPQSSLHDFYRELGDLFGIRLNAANRYGGFKELRNRWKAHIAATLFKPVLLIDEAQELPAQCLNEIRILGSINFDSDCLLTTILCGDNRLPEKLRETALIPLGTRIRTRLHIEPFSPQRLLELLEHLLDRAGATGLMTTELKHAIVEHCAGNPRILMTQAAELLDHAVSRQLSVMDESLFMDVFGRLKPAAKKSIRKK